jgi:predicted RNA-binding protein with PUA-like domain
MNYWLVKFAPFRYSWQDVLRNGKFEIYSVRNAQARNNLKEMKMGEKVLFYHSQVGNCIMGIMRVIEEAHQDWTTEDTRWLSVTFEPIESFDKPFSLQKLRETKGLENLGLLKQPRLAVMKLTYNEFSIISKLKKINVESN